ncbi:hypothetical protein D3C86_1965130 [compost metagenome]
MFTDREVDLMGGQQAVYQFRADLRAGNIPRHQKGGAVGSVGSVVAPSSFGGGATTNVEVKFEISGANNPREVVQEAMGELRFELQKAGVRLGGG